MPVIKALLSSTRKASGMVRLVAVVALAGARLGMTAERSGGHAGVDAGIDARLGPPVTVDGDHPFAPVASAAEWQGRSRLVRSRVALAAGLLPMPARPPVQATIHGRIAREGYSIEKVAFESFPGHVVTGNLYRPTGTSSSSAPRLPVRRPTSRFPRATTSPCGRPSIRP